MTWVQWFYLGWMGLMVVVAASSPRWAAGPRAAARFAREVGLPLTPELAEEVQRRLRFRQRRTRLSVVIAATAAAPLVFTPFVSPDAPTMHATFAFLALLMFGIGAGGFVAAMRYPTDAGASTRVGRLIQPTVADYLSPLERIGGRCSAIAGAVLAAVAQALPAPLEIRVAAGVTGLVAIAGVVATDAATRAILRRPQPASTPERLRWDDAFRAQALRDFHTALLSIGPLALAIGYSAMFAELPRADGIAVAAMIVAQAVFYGAIVLLALLIATKPAQHYLRRLWPEEAARLQPPPYGATPAEGPAA